MNRGLRSTALSYFRNGRHLIRGISLELNSGQGLVVAGPNGSGKSSLLRVLSGLISPTSGELFWKGQALPAARLAYHQELHFIGHEPGIKTKLTAKENLLYSLRLAGLAPCSFTALEESLAAVQLLEAQHMLAGQLSAGQKRRLSLARLLLIPKPLWILDEPFTNLDQDCQFWLLELLEKHLQNKGLVIIASHQALALKNGALFRELSLPQAVEASDV